MTQYTYHSGPLAEVRTVITAGTGRTVVLTYKPPMNRAGVAYADPAGVARPPADVPATVEIKFENGTARTFNAETGQWISETLQGKQKQHGHSPASSQRNPNT
jgi:hypothetical protein